MHGKMKIAVAATILTALVAYLAYLGTSSGWHYYLLVDECVTQSEKYAGKRLRVSGRVVPGSLKIADDRRAASFTLAGSEHTLPVACQCSVPDNLAEGMDVVVEGSLTADQHLQGERVITRCASKYASAVAIQAQKQPHSPP